MNVPNLGKQKDARVKLCEVLNGAVGMGYTGTLDFSNYATVATDLTTAGIPVRWDSAKSLFKARG